MSFKNFKKPLVFKGHVKRYPVKIHLHCALHKSPYSFRIRENKDQKNYISGQLSRRDGTEKLLVQTWFKSVDSRESNSLDAWGKLNVHKMFRRSPAQLLNVLCTFIVYLVSREGPFFGIAYYPIGNILIAY